MIAISSNDINKLLNNIPDPKAATLLLVYKTWLQTPNNALFTKWLLDELKSRGVVVK